MGSPESTSPDNGTSAHSVEAALARAGAVLEQKGIKDPNDALLGVAAVSVLSPAELRQAVRAEKTDGDVNPGVIMQARETLDADLWPTDSKERMRASVVGAFLGGIAMSLTMNYVGASYEDRLNFGFYGAMVGSAVAFLARGVQGALRVGRDRQELARQKVEDVARYTGKRKPTEPTAIE